MGLVLTDGNSFLVGIFVYLLLSGIDMNKVKRTSFKTAAGVILLMLVGYFLVYIITPLDLTYHLRTSLHRLFLHLWPATLFTTFLVVRASSSLKGGI